MCGSIQSNPLKYKSTKNITNNVEQCQVTFVNEHSSSEDESDFHRAATTCEGEAAADKFGTANKTELPVVVYNAPANAEAVAHDNSQQLANKPTPSLTQLPGAVHQPTRPL